MTASYRKQIHLNIRMTEKNGCIYFFKAITNGTAPNAAIAHTLYVTSKPHVSPKTPMRSTMRELIPKFTVI